MRLKLLLFSMLMVSGVLYAQTDDTIRHVIFSEVRIGSQPLAYMEITNMGSVDVDLLDFEAGQIDPWTDPYNANNDNRFIIGEYLNTYQPGVSTILAAGASITIAVVYDYEPEQWFLDPDNYQERVSKADWEGFADIEMHVQEKNTSATDSISPKATAFDVWNGRDCWYLRYHVGGDSAVIDQVGGMFNGTGDNEGRNVGYPYDVAGMEAATLNATLVRKFSVKEGNLDFFNARGSDISNSEWIPIEPQINGGEQYMRLFWTAGNHGDYNLTETSLTPKAGMAIDVDWTNYVITVPWGVRNYDSLMMAFQYTPGLAWHYRLNGADRGNKEGQGYADSAFISCRTGDTLFLYACGNDLDEAIFTINVAAPTEDANWVMPKGRENFETGWYGRWGTDPVFRVSHGIPGMDTISRVPFATRTDTLLKYLEKAPAASWEFDFVDGLDRVDLKDGDKLVVTAQNGSSKEYYIKIQDYRPSHNALLSAITWPDIPDFYKQTGVYGWVGDTIPGFGSKIYGYTSQVLADQKTVPGLKAIPEDLNTKIEVTRAVNLFGTLADKTITFKTTAEDNIITRTYDVTIERVLAEENKQHWEGEPFISEFVFRNVWADNYIEVCNPGTKPLDLSNYMFFIGGENDPVAAIGWTNNADEWNNRYRKYIPGLKWELQTAWEAQPRIAIEDPLTNAIVQPGDVFVMGHVAYNKTTKIGGRPDIINYDTWWVWDLLDIDFGNDPWGEGYSGSSCVASWNNENIYMWKILNDSVRNGLKPATDPADFELLETFGMGDGSVFAPVGVATSQTTTYIRKPEVYKAQALHQASFGATEEESEWESWDGADGDAQGLGWPENILYITRSLGQHYMKEVTVFKSTVASLAYKVSEGYSLDEEIRGLVNGVSRDEFLSSIFKKDDNQTLTVIKGDGSGDTLKLGTDLITDGDSLVVLSADSVNTTKYRLEVTAEGLNHDAVLQSSTYTIAVSGTTGTVGGFDYGTTLKSIVNGVVVPSGAVMNIIDEEDKYVSIVEYNFDTMLVSTLATDMMFFEVVAEDGVTVITYQLTPNATSSDAYVFSAVYEIDQDINLIKYVPKSTTVPTFMSHITPSTGASVEVQDKASFLRTMGEIYLDDKLIVTAADGVTKNFYNLQFLEVDVVDYLSYVVSSVYIVDQTNFHIQADPVTDINEATTVSAFLTNLTPASGATMEVYQDGVAKDGTDNLDAGDVLVVTALNGINISTYSITIDPSSVNDLNAAGISVYPNPSTGQFNVAGLESGSRIQIYNALGARVIDNIVESNFTTVSLANNEKGFYFMVVSNEQGILGQYKLVIE